MTLIETKDLTKIYQGRGEAITAVEGVSFEAGRGEFLLLMGPSGSGKSTLLNLLAGLDVPSSGQVSLGGSPLEKMTDAQITRLRRNFVSVVFQGFELIPIMNVRDNIAYPLKMQKVVASQRRERVEEVATQLGIEGLLGRKLTRISGGQKQRVAIARALVVSPQVLLADEITGSLDRETSESVYKLLKEKSHQEGLAVIAVTHDETMRKFADRFYHLIDGQLRREG